MFKLVIPSAGVGSRSGCTLNKALTTIGDRPMIAHVIDNFPNAAEVIVILGYQGDYVRQALEAIYGEGRIRFITVDDHTVGLGHTLLAARDELRCPFIFSPNDALQSQFVLSPTRTLLQVPKVNPDPDDVCNWMGYFTAGRELDTTQYRTLALADGQVVGINPKGLPENRHIYTGIAGVRDFEKFWDAMDDPAAVEAGESHGLKALRGVRAVEVPGWRDGGGARSLAQIKCEMFSRYNVLEKPDEAIWFTADDRVVKFATDEAFIAHRIERMRYLDPALLPRVTEVKPNLYTYPLVEGVPLSGVITEDVFDRLFDTMMSRVWGERLDAQQHRTYWSFYYDKTRERLDLFLSRDECIDRAEIINGVATPTVRELLARVDWDDLCNRPHVAHAHGDFHNENILLRADGSFTLLDWRQDFAGDLEYGDVYYDLAKFAHGLIVSHDEVTRGAYKVDRLKDDEIHIHIRRPDNLVRVAARFEAWLGEHNFDPAKVRTLTALIFLNICGLHTWPYSLFLFYLGKKLLTEALVEHSHR